MTPTTAPTRHRHRLSDLLPALALVPVLRWAVFVQRARRAATANRLLLWTTTVA